MDRWTLNQLKRMELGGTERFSKFLSGYPQLAARPRSERYASKAPQFYKRPLDAEVAGQIFNEAPPEENEAIHRAEDLTKELLTAEDAEDCSLETERAQLEATFLELQGKLQAALMPSL